MHILRKSPLSALLVLAAAALGHAQNATTTPVGAMTYSFPATTQLTSTYISVPLTGMSVFSGKVLTVGTNSITFEGTPFASLPLTQAGAPHFLRFQSGAQAGRTILVTATTPNSVTVDVTDNSSQTTNLNTSGFAVAVGDQVQIIPGDTLASFFGDNTSGNPVAFVGAAGALQADTVNVYNKTTARLDIYFFSTALGHWRSQSSTANQNALVVYPDSSVIVNRRAGRAAVTMTVVGEVPVVASATKTGGSGQVIYTTTRYPVDVRLSALNLTNWTKANSALSADTIGIFNPTTGRTDTYFQRTDNSWRRVGDANTDQSSLVLPAGSGIVMLKRASVNGPTSFIKSTLPYTL